ncbi:PAS domain-containing protein, partial [Parasedimentitalea maritima]
WLLRHVLAQGRAQLVLQGEVVERQRAEQAAHRREARLKALIGSMQDLVLVLDRGGHFSFVHAGDEALLLAPPEVLVGSHYRAFLPPDIARRLDGALAEVAASGEVRRLDYSLSVGGGPRDFSALISPLLSGDGEHDGVLLVVRDVTLERLHQANMSIAAVAFETHLGMMITDVDGRILKVNRTFTDITGYREDEVQGSRPDILRSGRH